ncbi:MAG TPA: hypothetical protein VFT39_12115, partial [Vicinamibacterales bacterium]|nr:hypothetical protein [Vicinamibacterales bacterium]
MAGIVTVAGFSGSLNSISTIAFNGLFALAIDGDVRTITGAPTAGSGATVKEPLNGIIALPNV